MFPGVLFLYSESVNLPLCKMISMAQKKGASAIIYDVLYLTLSAFILIIIFFSAPGFFKEISVTLSKTNSKVVSIDIASTISGVSLSFSNATGTYCFPSGRNYEVIVDGKNVTVKMLECKEKNSEYCRGSQAIPVSISPISFYSTDLANGCFYVKKEGSKIRVVI